MDNWQQRPAVFCVYQRRKREHPWACGDVYRVPRPLEPDQPVNFNRDFREAPCIDAPA